ncbi:hypothetical protein AVEN_54052-1 [Araneus ventricosus]|uniref:Uncharacterized protein n=1 Tax=Araneus ventricosus TaxID=182803 RepID=A0A4Y2EJJ5_ARAVE|nr:hypothetical protein AVEN_54052-1 [Araneus ventricosus]
MPRKRYPRFEEVIQRLFEDDDEQSDIDIVVVPLETVEASDEEEGNNNILNHDNDDLPCDTAVEIEVQSKRKFESSESSCSRAKKFKKSKTEQFKWIKKEPLNMPQPKNEEKDRIENCKRQYKGSEMGHVEFYNHCDDRGGQGTGLAYPIQCRMCVESISDITAEDSALYIVLKPHSSVNCLRRIGKKSWQKGAIHVVQIFEVDVNYARERERACACA